LKSLDAPDHTLQRGRVADLERKACVDMEGTNGRDVAFNGLMEDGTILAGEVSSPGHESEFSGWEELAGSESMLGVEPDEIKEGPLGRGVGVLGGGSKAVPEEKCDFSREARVRRIPVIWDCGVEDVRQSCGASWNRRLY
jgi:hypothetical protein